MQVTPAGKKHYVTDNSYAKNLATGKHPSEEGVYLSIGNYGMRPLDPPAVIICSKPYKVKHTTFGLGELEHEFIDVYCPSTNQKYKVLNTLTTEIK